MEDFQEQAQSSVQQVLGQIVEGPVILYFFPVANNRYNPLLD